MSAVECVWVGAVRRTWRGREEQLEMRLLWFYRVDCTCVRWWWLLDDGNMGDSGAFSKPFPRGHLVVDGLWTWSVLPE